ncbi:MAG: hypothetical protein O6952_03635 [Planctomycetota bacterium]|nr:hypothetical protein [Planctomycetota bacterium]
MIEMVIVMFIFTAAGALIFQVVQALMTSYRTGETKIQVEENLRRGMTSLLRELRQAQQATLELKLAGVIVPTTGDELKFVVPVDLDGNGTVLDDVTGDVEYSAPITFKVNGSYQLVREQDLNGNAVIEAAVPGEIQIIGSHVASVSFTLTDIAEPDIEVTLTVQRELDGDIFQHVLQETVIPRN